MRALVLLIAGSLALVAAACTLDSMGWIAAASHISQAVSIDNTGWFPLINLRQNSFLHWRLDTTVAPLFAMLPAFNLESGITLSALVVFFIGISLLFLRASKHRAPFFTVFACLSTCVALLCIFGWDLVLFQFLAWIPFFILCALACLHGREAFGIFIVLVLFFSLRMAGAANQLAPLATIVGLGCAVFLFRGLLAATNEALQAAGNSNSPLTLPPHLLRITGALAIICLCIAALPVFDAPSINGQNYPWQSHVVSEDWISGNVHPLLGPGPAIPFIDREMLKGYIGPLALALFLLTALLRLRVFRFASPLTQYCGNAALGGFLLTALDTNLPETLAYICPLAVLARIIPGSFLYPLADIILALSTVSLALALCLERRFRLQLIVCLALIIGSKSLLQNKLTRTQHNFSSNVTSAEEKFLISPSFPVIDALGSWVLQEQDRVQRTEFKPSSSVPMKALASHEKLGNEPQRMFDQDRQTRWSAGRAFQQGDEWLYLRFEQAQALSAIELAPAFFKSDFPAALRISTIDNCPENFSNPKESAAQRHEIISFNPWQGALGYTTENFPFYSAQKRVRAFFPKVTTTQCLLVEQIGKDSRVDWSVAEIRLGFESDKIVDDSDSLDVIN